MVLDKYKQMYYNIEKHTEVDRMERKLCPVDVISVCSAGGDIRPLRLQMVDEEHQMLRVNIEEVVSSQDIEYTGAEAKIFLCRATVWDRKWLFELKYTIRTHSWSSLGRLQ